MDLKARMWPHSVWNVHLSSLKWHCTFLNWFTGKGHGLLWLCADIDLGRASDNKTNGLTSVSLITDQKRSDLVLFFTRMPGCSSLNSSKPWKMFCVRKLPLKALPSILSSCQPLLCFSFYGEVPELALAWFSPPLHSLLTTLHLHWPSSSLDIRDWSDTG